MNCFVQGRYDEPINLRLLGRDISTNCIEEFNCAGYALGLGEWYIPRAWRNRRLLRNKEGITLPDLIVQKMLAGIGEDCIKEMCARFPRTLRIIEKLEDLEIDEYPIAFRLSRTDCHFMVRFRNRWTHKMGGSGIDHVSEEYVFGKEWHGSRSNYNSKIFLLARKKSY